MFEKLHVFLHTRPPYDLYMFSYRGFYLAIGYNFKEVSRIPCLKILSIMTES